MARVLNLPASGQGANGTDSTDGKKSLTAASLATVSNAPFVELVVDGVSLGTKENEKV